MAEALAFYTGQLEFTLDSGGEGATNSSLTRGEGHLMIETAADFYGDAYNATLGTGGVHVEDPAGNWLTFWAKPNHP